MKTMSDQISIVNNEIVICYGFYDSGPGVSIPFLLEIRGGMLGCRK